MDNLPVKGGSDSKKSFSIRVGRSFMTWFLGTDDDHGYKAQQLSSQVLTRQIKMKLSHAPV